MGQVRWNYADIAICVAIVFGLGYWPTSSGAADVELISQTVLQKVVDSDGTTTSVYDPDAVGNGPLCHIRLSGDIARGDLARIRSAFMKIESKDGQIGLCLNSKGGDFFEAMRISNALLGTDEETNKILDDVGMMLFTVIEPGAECLSSCAVIFMSGSTYDRESGFFGIARYLHVLGKLGFRNPYLSDAVERLFREERTEANLRAVQNAYRFGATAVRRLAAMGTGVGSLLDRDRMPSHLLVQMLSMDPGQVFRIDRAGMTIKYRISVFGIKAPARITACHLQSICENNFKFGPDLDAPEATSSPDEPNRKKSCDDSEAWNQSDKWKLWTRSNRQEGPTYVVQGGYGAEGAESCVIKFSSRDAPQIHYNTLIEPDDKGDFPTDGFSAPPPVFRYPPATRLEELGR